MSKLTKYWACHEKWISWLILVTHETLFTMRGVTTVIVQTHQILRLPRKMNLMIDPCHTWNAIYNARSNKCHCPNSPNTAPATQSNTHHWSLSHMKRYLQCAEQQVSLSKLTKYCACHAKWLSWYCHDWSSSHMKRYLQCAEQQVASSNITKYCACHAKWFSKISETFLQNRWNVNSNARPIRDRSENDPSMIRPWSEHETVTPQPASQPRLLFTPTTSILYWKIQHFALRLSFQISPNTAPATKSDTSTSPNTAPATKNESHDWSLSHMKRYLQCAEQQVASSNITKYCACHAKWLSWLILVTYETLWNAIYNARNNRWHPPTSPNTAPATQNDSPKFQKHFSKTDETSIPMRDRSETVPRMIRPWSENETVRRNPPRNRGYFSRPPRAFCIEKYNISRSGYHSKFHRILRLPRKVTVQLHRILRLPRKVTLERHQIVHLPRKVTLERHQIVHLPRKVTLELHQTVHLPRKVTLRYSTLL